MSLLLLFGGEVAEEASTLQIETNSTWMSSTASFQYQVKAEPPFAATAAEIKTVDKYYQLPNQPKQFPKYLVPEGHYSVDSRQLTQAERSSIDKYYQLPNQPKMVRKELVAEGHFSKDAQAQFPLQLTQWWGKYPDPFFSRKLIVPSDQVNPLVYQQAVEDVTADKWFRETEKPRWFKKPLVYEGLSIFDLQKEFPILINTVQNSHILYPLKFQYQGRAYPVYPISAEIVTVDKWFRLTETPPHKVRPLVSEGFPTIDPYQLTLAERSTIDKYWQQLSEPKRFKKPLVPEGISVFDTREFRVPVDRWFRETGLPPKTYKPLIREGQQVNDPFQLTQAERISYDKWFSPLERPRWDRKRLQHVFPSLFGQERLHVVEEVTLDKYWKQVAEPKRFRSELVREGVNVTDTAQILVNLEKYWKQLSEPVRVGKQLVREGIAVFDTKEFRVDLDRWYRETQLPPKAAKPLVKEGYTIDPYQLTLAERTSYDKWFAPLERPRFDVKRNQFDYPTSVDDRLFVDPSRLLSLSTSNSHLIYPVKFQYQARAYPVYPVVIELVTIDKFFRQYVDKFVKPQLTPYVNEFVDSKPISFRVGQTGNFVLNFDKHRIALVQNDSAYPLVQQEVVTLDKFYRPIERVLSFRLPRWEQFVIDNRHLLDAERTTVDKYWRQTSEPKRFLPQLVRESQSQVFTAFVTTFVVGTKSSLYLPIRELPKYDHTVAPFKFEDTSAFTDRWLRETQTPPKKAAPRLQGWFAIDPRQLTQAERSTVDKYWQQLSMPRRFPSQLVREGVTVMDAKLFRVDLDKYWRQLVEPQRHRAKLVREGVSVFDTREFRVQVDRWFRETQLPPKTRIPHVRVGWHAIDPRQLTQAERSTVDKWFKDNNPVMRLNKFRDTTGTMAVHIDETVTLDKYWRQLEIGRKGPQLLRAGYYTIDPRQLTQSEYITLDKWYKDHNPLFSKKVFRDVLTSVVPLRQDEVLTVDKWFKEIERPYSKKNVLLENIAFQFTPSELITLDKWFKDNFVPTLLGRKNVTELHRLSFVQREEVFDLSTWLPGFIEITRAAKFRTELFQLISSIEFPTPLTDLDWLVQTNEPIFTNFVKSWLIQQLHITHDQAVFIIRTMCLNTIAVVMAMISNTLDVLPAVEVNSVQVLEAIAAESAEVSPAVVSDTIEVVEAMVVDTVEIQKAVVTDIEAAACRDDE